VSKFEFIESGSEEYFDIHVEVGFTKTLNSVQMVKVLQLILEVFNSEVASKLFEGISFLQLTETSLSIKFRYSTVKDISFNISDAGEDTSRQKSQFIFYLFAKIDSQYSLSDVPFPPNFGAFITLPDEYLR
jgi:hypothetical protein